jgi:hypothetical protein
MNTSFRNLSQGHELKSRLKKSTRSKLETKNSIIQKENLVMFERLVDIDNKSNAKLSLIKRKSSSRVKLTGLDGLSDIITTDEKAEEIASKYFKLMSGINSSTRLE